MSALKTPNYRDFLDLGGRRGHEAPSEEAPVCIGRPMVSRENVPSAKGSWFLVHGGGKGGWSLGSARGREIGVRRPSQSSELWVVYASGGGAVHVRPVRRSDDFSRLRERIQGFEDLPSGWDSYEADAPSRVAIGAALQLVDLLESVGVLPEWVTATSEASILMRYRLGDEFFEWEFHSDGDVAVMRKPLFERESYHDLSAEGLATFFLQCLPAR